MELTKYKSFDDGQGLCERRPGRTGKRNFPSLPGPYADILEDGIHELRIKLSGDQIRILYFFCYKNFIVLTHAFTKNTDKVPKSEIKKAQKIRENFKLRFSESQLKEAQDEKL